MNPLDTEIREYIDTVASPVSLQEAQDRADRVGTASHRRMPVGVAAAVIVVAGVAAVAVALSERNTVPDVDPVTTASVATPISEAAPPVSSFDVVVPAGLTVEEIAALLAGASDTVDRAAFVQAANDAATSSDLAPGGVDSAEGLLAPGPYTISESDSETEIALQMIVAMEDLTGAANINVGAGSLGRSPYEVLIIASMIEREAYVARDYSGISRVIHNRLLRTASDPNNPMPLQLDSSVIYGAERLGINTDGPFNELRSIPSEWNTYLLPGLPSTPISNPSAQAIDAALHPRPNPGPNDALCIDVATPADCLLLYYVIGDDDGSVNFATTPQQHEVNVDRASRLGLL